MARQIPVPSPVEDADVVDYRRGNPWDFGLLPDKLPDMLRQVAACRRQPSASTQTWPAPQTA